MKRISVLSQNEIRSLFNPGGSPSSLSVNVSAGTVETAKAGNCGTEPFQRAIFHNPSKFSFYSLFVANQSAELYRSDTAPDSDGAAQTRIERQQLHTPFRFVAVGGKWVQVSRRNDTAARPYGWIKKIDLLCAKTPLVAGDGPELLCYIKRDPVATGRPNSVFAYDRSVGGLVIARLSPFQPRYVMDRQNGRLLLSSEYYVDGSIQWVGWANRIAGFIWSSIYGIRPSEAAGDRQVCAYPPYDRDFEQCIPFPAALEWYKTGRRIPGIGQDEDGYRVLLPGSVVGYQSDEPCPRSERGCISFATTFPARIPNLDDWILDIWLSAESLGRYISFLDELAALRREKWHARQRENVVRKWRRNWTM